jgi:hypothetical protein
MITYDYIILYHEVLTRISIMLTIQLLGYPHLWTPPQIL